MKSRQFCSVCKEWLDMEVVPTSDGEEDDGVIWFRCPQCQGFLPKLSGAEAGQEDDSGSGTEGATAPADSSVKADTGETGADRTGTNETMPWDSPADMMAAQERTGGGAAPPVQEETPGAAAEKSTPGDASEKPPAPGEPLHEYAALLAEKDRSEPTPYRPWETYEVGQCIHHMAWEDCGVVVAKEDLPGGRQVIKCYFEEAGVVRLIEKAPR